MKKKHQKKREGFQFKRFARKSYSAFNSIGKQVSIRVMAGITLLMMSAPVVAQGEPKTVREQEKELDEIVVTASISETLLENMTTPVTVVTRQEIEQAPIHSISDLLQHAAQINVAQRGGHGVQADLSIRGGSSDQVAVLINGINLSNAQTGHFSLNIPINLSDIERIEILHGPSALLSGSAFSGAINIITRKDIKQKIIASIEAGMHAYKAVEVRGATKLGNTINSLSVGYKASDGYIANSDYDMYNLTWQTRLRLKESNSIDFLLGYTDKKFGANTFYSAEYPNQYEENTAYTTTVKGQFGTKLKLQPSLFWSRHHDQFDLIRGTSTGQNFHRADTYGGGLILSYQHILGTTSASIQMRKDEIMSTKLGRPMVAPHRKYTMYDARTNTASGVEHRIQIDKVMIQAGGLFSYNTLETDKLRFFPSASASYSPFRNIKLKTVWTKSTRIPTFTDLFYTMETHTANENLKPEQTQSWEVGVDYKNSFVNLYSNFFMSWGKDIIDWVKQHPDDKTWASWNHTKIDTKGIEVGAKFYFSDLMPSLDEKTNIQLGYTYISQDADTQEMISLYSLNYMRHKFTANINHRIYKGFSASWYFRYQDRAGTYMQYIDTKPTENVAYPAFAVVDAKLLYEFDEIALFMNLNNIFNKKYYDLGNIPQAGFWLNGGVSYKF